MLNRRIASAYIPLNLFNIRRNMSLKGFHFPVYIVFFYNLCLSCIVTPMYLFVHSLPQCCPCIVGIFGGGVVGGGVYELVEKHTKSGKYTELFFPLFWWSSCEHIATTTCNRKVSHGWSQYRNLQNLCTWSQQAPWFYLLTEHKTGDRLQWNSGKNLSIFMIYMHIIEILYNDRTCLLWIEWQFYQLHCGIDGRSYTC